LRRHPTISPAALADMLVNLDNWMNRPSSEND
jgi:hypothetical protein